MEEVKSRIKYNEENISQGIGDYAFHGRPPSQEDLSYIEPDFLIEGVSHKVFHLVVIFETEAKADQACKYISTELGDQLLALEYDEVNIFTHDYALRTLFITFDNKELFIELYKIVVAVGPDTYDQRTKKKLPYTCSYIDMIKHGKAKERIKEKNLAIKLKTLLI